MPRRSLVFLLILAVTAAPILAHAHARPLLDEGEGRIVANGIEHWYRYAAADRRGLPIVVMHGGPGGNSYIFERTAGPRLERFAPVLYYDQRGCGRSGAPADESAYSVNHIVADLEALLDALGFEKIILLGLSFGGEFALEYALAHPERIEKLVLSGSPAGDYERIAMVQTWYWAAALDGERRAKLSDIAREPLVSPYERIAAAWSFATPDEFARFVFVDQNAAARNRALRAESGLADSGLMSKGILNRLSRRRPTLFEDLARIDIPTLVLAGLHDRSFGVEMIREIAIALPNAEFELFEDSAHVIFMDEPEKFARVVRRFIEE